MSSFVILVDSSCDLSPEYMSEHGIEMIPIQYDLDGVEHSQGYWQEISGEDFYNALRNGSVAKTSQTNPDTYTKAFMKYAKQGKDVLFLVLSSGLSASYLNTHIAMQEAKEEYPECKIFPIDTLSATCGTGLLSMLAVKKRAEGFSAEETAGFLEKKKHSCIGLFTVDDLMYLHRGGRLSKLSAVAGSVLGIKPLLNLSPEGTLALKDKARNRKAALQLLISQTLRSIKQDTVLDTVVISHSDCKADAELLAEMLREAVKVNDVIILMMGPVIGAHLGPSAITMIFEADMMRTEYESKFY